MKIFRPFYTLGALVFITAAVLFSSGTAHAWDNQNNNNNSNNTSNSTPCPTTGTPIDIPLSTVVKGDENSQHRLATKQVSNGDYSVQIIAENQESTHPNSNITVSSGNSSVMVNDVENQSFHNKTADGTLHVTNGQVAVSVQLGRDGIFSGGAKVTLSQCQPAAAPAPTTPTPPAALPNTGPTTAIVIAAATLTGIAGYTATILYLRRKATN